jgi:hypothetical protein
MTFQDRLSRSFHRKGERNARQRQKEAAGDPGVSARVLDIVLNVVRHRFAATSLPAGVTLDDLDLNPLERIYIADDIEREWHISLEEDEIDAWDGVGDIELSVRNRSSAIRTRP